MPHITLCADDYSQNKEISQGIIKLVKQNRLSAVSCLTTTKNWPLHAEWLKPFCKEIDIGLHFNLTLGKPLGPVAIASSSDNLPTLQTLLMKSLLRRLPYQAIVEELNHQIDSFNQALDKLPDFIDGHQHIHHLPIIRQAVLAVYKDRLQQNNAYIRISANSPSSILKRRSNVTKKLIIAYTGAFALKKKLHKNHIPHNQAFSGIYSFKDSENYRELFFSFLKDMKDQGLIMCHPGLKSNDINDTIADSRWNEYQYLSGERFLEDCAQFNVTTARLLQRQI